MTKKNNKYHFLEKIWNKGKIMKYKKTITHGFNAFSYRSFKHLPNATHDNLIQRFSSKLNPDGRLILVPIQYHFIDTQNIFTELIFWWLMKKIFYGVMVLSEDY